MLKIDYYENESYHCASINAEDFDGYTMLGQIEPRCKTYKEAKKELLEHATKLRDALSNLIERETNPKEIKCSCCGMVIKL